jgi:hypothetical protein
MILMILLGNIFQMKVIYKDALFDRFDSHIFLYFLLAKDLVQGLLTVKRSERLTIDKALVSLEKTHYYVDCHSLIKLLY